MPNFPDKNISGKPISSSFQNLLQLTGSYLLNAVGDQLYDLSLVSTSSISTSFTSSYFYELPVQSGKFSPTASRINSSNYAWELYHARGESALWQFQLPHTYHNSMSCTLQYYPVSSQGANKNVIWNIYINNIAAGSTALNPVGYNLFVVSTSSVSSLAAGVLSSITIRLTGSTFTAGDFMIYKLERSTASYDNATGDIALVSNILEWN